MTAGKGGKPAVIKTFASSVVFAYTNKLRRNGYRFIIKFCDFA